MRSYIRRGGFRPCRECGRILMPLSSGILPPHRIPAATGNNGKAPPLTGPGDPWCQG